MKKLFLILLLVNISFALTPFSLEGLQEAKVKISDKKKFLGKELKAQLTNNILVQLKKAGLKTDTKLYSKIIIKVQGIKIDKKYALLTSLFVLEDMVMLHDKSNVKMAITYKMDDFIDSTNPKEDIKESIEYLVSEFIDQYKDEN